MNKEDFLIWQYRKKPKATATIRAVTDETKNTFQSVIDLAKVLNVDEAEGYALDLVGRHVGISRVMNQAIAKEYFGFVDSIASLGFGQGEFYRFGDSLTGSVVLSDFDYRFFIKAKILKNYQDGTLGNIVDSVRYLFGDNSNVIDSQNMSMNIMINNKRLNSLIMFAVSKLDIIVRPIGVMYNYIILTSDKPFGFAGDSTAYGFNEGAFVRLQEVNINGNN